MSVAKGAAHVIAREKVNQGSTDVRLDVLQSNELHHFIFLSTSQRRPSSDMLPHVKFRKYASPRRGVLSGST